TVGRARRTTAEVYPACDAMVTEGSGAGSAGHCDLRLTRRLVVRPDVDLPTGETGGQPGILPLPADRQRQLEIRNGDPGRPVRRVDDLNPQGLGRGERVADEVGRVVGPVDNVDLLTVQLAHHGADPGAHGPDAGALGVHPGNG